MKSKLLALLATAFILNGCGGGSSSAPEPAPPVKVNTPPSITGLERISVLANQSSELTLTLNDSDGDAVQLNIEDQPDWLTISTTGNSSIITVNGTFWTIGEHQLAMTISDGKATVDYSLEVVIADNSDAFQEIQLTNESFGQSWLLDNGQQFHLYQDGNGLFVSQDKNYIPLTWKVEYGFGYVTLNELACGDCPDMRFEFEALYHENGRYRFFVAGDENEYRTNTLLKEEPKVVAGLYGTVNEDWGRALKISGDNEMLGEILSLYNRDFFLNGTLSSEGYQANYEGPPPTFYYNTVENKSFAFYRKIKSLEAHYGDDELLIFKIIWSPELHSEKNKYSHPDLEVQPGTELAFYLGIEATTYAELSIRTPVEVPTLTSGKSYISKFITSESNDSVIGKRTANELIIDADGEGRLRKENYDLQGVEQQDTEINWAIENNSLVISYDDSKFFYEFYQSPTGQLQMYGYDQIYDVETNIKQLREFTEKENLSLTQEQLLGEYLHKAGYLDRDNTQAKMNLLENNQAIYSQYFHQEFVLADHGKVNDYWKLLDDGSVLIISNFTCSEGKTFQTCFEELYNEASSVRHRRLTPIKITDREYIFKYEFLFKTTNYTYQVSDIRSFVKTP